MDSNNNRPNPLIARGTVIRILPVQEGVSKSGNAWRKGAFVIETEAQYPRTICFNIWNNRIDEFPLTEGDLVEVRFDVESREYMERWYTDVTAYSVSKVDQTAAAAPEADPFAGKAPYVESAAPSTGFASQAPEAGAQNQFGGSFDPAAGDNADDLPF
ncbi:hypothetical protein PORUE0001_1244 [Porphyromonas uenonis 60-3]|uniref:DUF3127 domain-containing protein n=1 Tax=Porphyromonas uenonis 60-3 TaxID=596327 RepID=C2MAG9_9PORP|nr:DUF3127 domain-containing protein [Porphyromonas uenonis]EEK17317.1 hypothetical protein PORUE0001_1244 [Porphyromonas uenonis 60-3]